MESPKVTVSVDGFERFTVRVNHRCNYWDLAAAGADLLEAWYYSNPGSDLSILARRLKPQEVLARLRRNLSISGSGFQAALDGDVFEKALALVEARMGDLFPTVPKPDPPTEGSPVRKPEPITRP